MSAETRTIYTAAQCAEYGIGPAHSQHWRHSDYFGPDGQILDVEALMALLQTRAQPDSSLGSLVLDTLTEAGV